MVGYLQRQLRSQRAEPTATATIYITAATKTTGTRIEADYNQVVTAGDFDPLAFRSFPSLRIGTLIVQVTPTRLQVRFGGNIAADNFVTYTGATPNVLTPQTVIYT